MKRQEREGVNVVLRSLEHRLRRQLKHRKTPAKRAAFQEAASKIHRLIAA